MIREWLMRAFRLALMLVALVTIASADVEGAQKVKKKTPPAGNTKGNGEDTSQFLTAPLFSAEEVTAMKLTAEQKPQVTKLTSEFTTKLKEVLDKAKADPEPAPGKGKGKAKGPARPMTPGLKEVTELREEYEGKVKELLTEAQKESLDALRAKKAEALLNGGPAKTPPKK